MAYIADEKKKELDPNAQPGQATAPAIGQESGIITGSAPVASSSPQSASGTGGWTNIQDYLKANAGDTRSTDALKKEVGSTFDQEQKSFDTEANKVKTAANDEVSKKTISTDQASKLIEQAGSAVKDLTLPDWLGGKTFTYKGNDYANSVDTLKNAVNATWAGPNDFSYGVGAKAQEYGGNIKNDNGFSSIMSALYNQAAGGRMGSGAKNLQSQLDANNQNLNSARQSLIDQYGQLQNGIKTGIDQTNAALADTKKNFDSKRDGIKNHLSSTADTNWGSIRDAVNKWNEDESALAEAGKAGPHGQEEREYRASSDGAAFRTFETLNKDDFYDNIAGDRADLSNVDGVDSQRNRYNAIMDALGLSDRVIKKSGVANDHGRYGFNQQKYDKAWADIEAKRPNAKRYI